MNFKFIYFIILLSLLLIPESEAQNYLLLQRGKNEKTRLIYEEGERITYLQNGLDYYITDVIKEINTDHLVLAENVLLPSQIVSIDIRNKDERNLTLQNLTILPAGGAVLLLIAETVNGIHREGGLNYNRGSLVWAGSLFASSLLLSQLRYKYFRVRGRNKIQIVQLDEEE